MSFYPLRTQNALKDGKTGKRGIYQHRTQKALKSGSGLRQIAVDSSGYTENSNPVSIRPGSLENIMVKNIHSIERVVRVLVGLAVISLVFIGPQSPWGWLGLIPVATGLIGWCPPYAMLGISTCRKPQQKA